MADLFGNSTLPGWQMYTPASYAIAAAPANAEIGRNFSQAYQSASKLSEEKRQFDASQGERRREFEETTQERKRQFDILNPSFPSQWPDSPAMRPNWMDMPPLLREEGGPVPAGQPAIVGESGPEVIVPKEDIVVLPNSGQAPVEAKPTWMTNTSPVNEPPNWIRTGLDLSTPASAVAALRSTKTVAEFNELRSKIEQQHPAIVGQKAFNQVADREFLGVAKREAMENERQRISNNSVAQRTILENNKKFLTDLRTLPTEDQIAISNMAPDEKTGGPSTAQLQAFGVAKEAQRVRAENDRKQAEIEALQRGDQQRTVISDKGVTKTFTPTPVGKDVNVEPREKVMSDGSVAVWMPGGTGLHFRKANGDVMPAPSLKTINDFVKSLPITDPDRTNFMAMGKEMLKQSLNKTSASPTIPKAANVSTNNASAPVPETPNTNTVSALPKLQNNADVDKAIRLANEAIKAGKDPKIIRQRLKDMGITLRE